MPQEYAFTPEDAVARWYGNCVSQPRELAGSPLAYEPRAAWGCLSCGVILVGTKSGHLYDVGEGPSGNVRMLRQWKGVSIQAIHGCANTARHARREKSQEPVALVGTSDGKVYFLKAGDDPRSGWKPLDSLPVGGVVAARLVDDSSVNRRPWCFVATAERTIELLPLHGGGEPARRTLPRNVRYVLALTRKILDPADRDPTRSDDPRQERRWQLVAADGHVSTAVVRWPTEGSATRPELRHLEIGCLRHAPLYVASERHDGAVRSILYGSEAGLHVAIINKDGGIREHDLLTGKPIRYARITKIFGVDFVIAADLEGGVRSRRWEHPEDSSDHPWLTWPRLASEAVFVDIAAVPANAADPSETFATVLLRTHEVCRVRLFNINITRRCLRDRRPWMIRQAKRDLKTGEPVLTDRLEGKQPKETTDDLRYAEISIDRDAVSSHRLLQLVRRGGARTLEAAVDSLLAPPGRSYKDVLDISVAIVVAAIRHDAQSIAGRLHRALLVFLRDRPAPDAATAPGGEYSDRQALEKWLPLLKKYFVMAPTFSQKRTRLDELVAINAERGTADAFTYAARLYLQGFDVSWEREIASPVMAMSMMPSREERTVIGLSLGDGSIRILSAGSDRWSWSLNTEFYTNDSPKVRERAASWGGDRESGTASPFGIYSRILHASSVPYEHWLVAFRDEYSELPPGVIAASGHPIKLLQAYSVIALDAHRTLLGLRHVQTPLAICDTVTGDTQLVEATWGIERHGHSSSGGERRIWAIAALDDDARLLAVAAEDGYLRIGSITADSGRHTFNLLHPGPANAEYLGSGVRALGRFDVEDARGTRRFLVAGTMQAELFCFQIVGSADRDGPPLLLKFRDVLRSPIVSLFVMDVEPGRPQLCVLEDSGRVTTYDVRGGVHDGRREFLGQRTGHYIVADGATVGMRLGDGRMLVAGWRDDEGRGRLRVVEFRSRDGEATFRTPPDPRYLERAELAIDAALARNSVDQSAAGESAAGESAADVLAALPLADAAARKATIAVRVRRAWQQPDRTTRLEDLCDAALTAYPNNREELKVFVETIDSLLASESMENRLELFDLLDALFIHPQTPRYERRNPKLQATLARRLLRVDILRLWHARYPGNAGIERLQTWVERHLQHPEPFVRVDTLRALSEVLLDVVRMPPPERRQAIADIFPGPPDTPPVASAGWLLDSIARFLYSHPPTKSGTECDTSTWAAVSVLVNLVRLFPDSVMVICNHFTVNRTSPLIFEILQRRLTSADDALIVRRLNRYVPWLDRPSMQAIAAHCAPFLSAAADGIESVTKELQIQRAEPDYAYLDAYAKCYHAFAAMARPRSIAALIELRKYAGGVPIESPPEWARRLWKDRKSFMQFTAGWIQFVGGMLEDVANRQATDVDRIQDLSARLEQMRVALERLDTTARSGASTGQDPATGYPWHLFAPELQIASVIVQDWQAILTRDTPRAGDPIGDETLGPRLPGVPRVFEIVERRDKLAAISPILSTRNRRAAEAVCEIIRELSLDYANHIVRIDRVLGRENDVAIIMDRVPGKDLSRVWQELAGRTTSERTVIARQLMLDISRSLIALHRRGIFHGDIRPDNIMRRTADSAFILIDFDKSGNEGRLATSFSSGSPVPKEFRLSDDIDGKKDADCIALMSICYQLIAGGQEWQRQFDGGLNVDDADPWLRNWLIKLEKRWRSRERSVSPNELRKEAIEDTGAIFVAGVTSDTERIRRRLFEANWTFSPWYVQGLEWPGEDQEATVAQAYRLIDQCSVVVFLIGQDDGCLATGVPHHIEASARRLFESGASSWNGFTYTECEYAIAKELRKPILHFDVRGGPRDEASDVNRAGSRLRQFIGGVAVEVVGEDNCVKTIREALERSARRRSQI